MLAIENDTFDPVTLSLEENAFLIEHAGKAPAVVQRLPFPPGVNPRAVLPVISELYALAEVERAEGRTWAGVEKVREQCRTYLAQRQQWDTMKARAGKAFPSMPSMAAWDSRGNPHMGGVGSDAGHVRTYFDADGNRQRFAVSLHDSGPSFAVPWVQTGKVYDALEIDEVKGAITCPICAHAETFNPDAQSTRNLAHSRMARHLLGAKKEPDAHKALHTKVFG